jgi:hypothetical protein
MAKRLNDTASLAAKPLGAGESHSISTRKIDNGYITTTSSCNEATGEYRSSQTFTKNPPRITPPAVDGRQGVSPDGAGSALRGAVEYLKAGE